MKTHLVIAVSRQYGSGGREVGSLVAKKLGIHYYDRQMIEKTVEEMGYRLGNLPKLQDFDEEDPATVESAFEGDEFKGIFSRQKLFDAQSAVIRDLAGREDCVIVGRCADYILQDSRNCHSIFVCGSLMAREERVMQRHGVSKRQANAVIRRMDKQRSAYYHYYTEMRWGAAEHYDLCLSTSRLTIDTAAEVIASYIRGLYPGQYGV